MSEQDLRQQAHQIREALERYSREELIHILTHVYRQYVVEGSLGTALPPPTGLQADELTGLSFAQVIERLQLRMDLPELQLFDVQGGRVSVRIDGRLAPLDPPTGRPEGPAIPGRQPVQFTLRQQPAAPPAAPAPAPAVESQAPQAPGVSMQAARPAAPAPAPAAPAPAVTPPTPVPAGPVAAGPSAAPSAAPSARPAAAGAATASSARPAAARPAQGQGQGQAAPAPAAPSPKDDRQDGGGRFTLLEVD